MQSAAPSHPEYGPGIRISACQFLSAIGQQEDKQGVFLNIPFDGNYDGFPLSPDIIGGQMALDARDWSYYVFRRAAIVYTNLVSDTTPAGFVMSYSPDVSSSSTATHNYETVQSLKDTISSPFKSDCALEIAYTGKNVYNCEVDAGSTAGEKLSEQGFFYGIGSKPSPDATTVMGEVLIHYVVDYYARCMDQGFTLSVTSKDVYDSLVAKLYRDRCLHHRISGLIEFKAKIASKVRRAPDPVPEWLNEVKSSYIYVDEKCERSERKEEKKILPSEPATPSKRALSSTR
jgi:hypothetical protein